MAQENTEVSTSDFSITLPTGWTYQTAEGPGELLKAFSEDSTYQYKISKVSIEPDQNSFDFLNHIEDVMFDLGYSENIADSTNRFKDSTKASNFNADDIALGVFAIEKDEQYLIQTVIIYHKENWIYMCVITYPSENYFEMAEEMKLLTSTFRLKD